MLCANNVKQIDTKTQLPESIVFIHLIGTFSGAIS